MYHSYSRLARFHPKLFDEMSMDIQVGLQWLSHGSLLLNQGAADTALQQAQTRVLSCAHHDMASHHRIQ